MKLLILTRYAYDGASSRYRFYQYLHLLSSCEIEITVHPLFSNSYVKNIGRHKIKQYWEVIFSYLNRIIFIILNSKFDLIFIEKELLPWMPHIFESILISSKTPYIVDYDDATFHCYDSHSKYWVRKLLGNKIDRIMQSSEVVIVYTQKKSLYPHVPRDDLETEPQSFKNFNFCK